MPNSRQKAFAPLLLVFIMLVVLIAIFGVLSKVYHVSKDSDLWLGFPETGDIITTPFVSANGTKLYLNGEPYQFTGVNAFHLGTLPGANAGCGGHEANAVLLLTLQPNKQIGQALTG